jgi:hypothetical protein
MALKQTMIKHKWKHQEKQAAKKLSGKNRAGSGNKWNAPGDAIGAGVLMSCKRTDSASISITDSHLKKHIEDAMMEGKSPVWMIEVGGRTYYMFHETDVEISGEGVKVDIGEDS